MEFIQLRKCSEIVDCMKLCADDMFNKHMSTEENICELADKYAKYGCFFIALEGDEILGEVAFYCNDEVSRVGFLSMIVVRKNYQHKGIGYELLHKVEKICLEKDMLRLRLEVDIKNESAKHFYFKNGYREEIIQGNSLFLIKYLL